MHANPLFIKIHYALLFIICALAPMLAEAHAWTADDFPIPYLQDARRHVSDPDGILSPAVRDTVDALLTNLENMRGVQSVVAVARNLDGDDPYEFGMALARKYKIGSKKQNSGLIVVLATDDRSYQILTGTGLEGTLPDAICRRVENRYMLPALKQGDWDTAILSSVEALRAYAIQDESLLPPAPAGAQSGEDDGDAPIVALFLVMAMFGVIYVVYLRRKLKADECPVCHNHTLRPTSQTLRRTGDGKPLRIYKCAKCGYTEARDDSDDGGNLRRNSDAASLWPLIFMGGPRGGGGFGGFGGGGSFGGGTFGGGSFGGGGAGGRF